MGIYHKIKNLIKNLTKIRITEQIIKKFPKKRNNCSLLSGTGPAWALLAVKLYGTVTVSRHVSLRHGAGGQ